MEFNEWFPTVTATVDLSSEFDFDSIEELLKSAPMEDHVLLTKSKSSHNVIYALDHPELSSLKGRLQECVDEYCSSVGLMPVTIGESWHNIMGKDATLMPHRHVVSVISGAFYINADEGSSVLGFETPLDGLKMCEQVAEKTPYTITHEYIEPRKGLLVLFPSWLKHGSFYNQNENRMVISFNTDVDRYRK